MADFTQANRPLAATTPLGADKLLLVGVSGREALSQLFQFQLDLLAESQTTVDFDKLLGAPVGVTLVMEDGKHRYLHGICSRLVEGGEQFRVRSYRIELVPKVWLLTRRARSRIFQTKSVPDILKVVLQGFDVKWNLQGTFEPREYCVQYRETDFQFASRLMEEEGIYYYFTHADGAHTMVVANTPQGHADVPERPDAVFHPAAGGEREPERVVEWSKSQELRSGKVTLRDHTFELPDKNLEASAPIADSVAVGAVTHKTKVGGNADLELYDYPGGYARRVDGISPSGGDQAANVQKVFSDNKRTAEIQMQEEAAQGILATGQSDCMQFTAGHRFSLTKHPNADGSYVLTEVQHAIFHPWSAGGQSDAGAVHYNNTFACIPAAMPFRPARTTPKPVVQGAQTAVVVGPSGEEIFTDKYGRVRVRFRWDREGKTTDGADTCWVRVGTHWAGKQWGAVHIPRIGQEVIVDFLEGDPDRPIAVGSVYNAEQMPPYTLPDHKTQSGIKSRSTPKGTPDNFNELRFEDKKGSEQVYFHAEMNFDRVVENNDTLKVGSDKAADGSQTIEIWKDRTETVKEGDETVTIEKGDRTVEVTEGDESLTVGEGSRTVEVTKGDDTHDIGAGNRIVTIGGGNDTLTISKGDRTVEITEGKDSLTLKGDLTTEVQQGNQTTNLKQGDQSTKLDMGNRSVEIAMGNDELKIKMGNQTTKLDLGSSTTEAMQSIEFKVGQSSVKIDQMGVTIKGMMITVEAQVQLKAKGLMAEVSGDAMLQAKGAITMIG